MKTLAEKVAYNQTQNSDFSNGYLLGVRWYGEYPKLSVQGRKTQIEVIDTIKVSAKMGDGFSKGIMCGIRDSANERKAKKK